MYDLLFRLAGRASLALDPLRRLLATPARPIETRDVGPARLDRTGLVVQDAQRLPVLWDDGDVLYVQYDSFAHSLWRAQELSLLRQYRAMLQPPVLDFGTGDGSFAAALFDHVAFGVDNDPDALRVAAQFGVYGTLVQGTHDRIPVADGVVRSVFSNSVLEHVVDLTAVLAELRRVLCPDGVLIFTVPVPQYTSDLRRYFGRRAADRINAESIHRNLHTATEWQALLATAGFRVQESRSYQPGVVTFWYRMLRLLGPRGLGRLAPGLPRRVWRWTRASLVSLVRRSIHNMDSGGNILIVAR